MSLKKFLIIVGCWVAFLPHLGFSILTENVLASITGFILIVASLYLAAIEDKHKYKRIVQGETVEKVNDFLNQINPISKNNLKTYQKSKEIKPLSTSEQKIDIQQSESKDMTEKELDEGRPRIKKAVSDVKLKMESLDDIVS